MAILGNTLKEKRESLGLSLEQVSEKLEVQERFLKALEEENLDVIPNEYYVKAFMKQYGDFLKIDGEKLLNNYYKEQENLLKEQEELEKQAAIQKEQEEQELLKQAEEKLALERLEKLQRQQESENLRNLDKPTQTSLDLAEYEHEQESELLKSVPVKQGVKKGCFILPIAIIGGISTLFLIYSAVNQNRTTSNQNLVTTTTSTTSQNTETTTVSSLSAQSSESTTQSQIETTVTTTRAPETTSSTTVVNTPQASRNQSSSTNSASRQQEYPSGSGTTYVKASDANGITYGLGAAYKNYTGNYNFVISVTEPTWVSVTIHNRVIFEGVITAPWRFHTYNTAANAIVKTGKAFATKLTMNNTNIPVPTNARVQTVTVDLRR